MVPYPEMRNGAGRPLGLVGLIALFPGVLSAAGLRSSPDYVISAESADSAGGRAGSTHYTQDGSLGGLAGVSSATSSLVATAKAGYVAGLCEVVALQLAAGGSTVGEQSSRQITGVQLLDDATTVSLLPETIVWAVKDGPLTGITAGGLVTAGPVYEATAATVQGHHEGRTATLDLTVLDTSPDNFGFYAGDGLSDGWQVHYFGQNNPDAGPLLDPDGDGQDNRFEFAAGLAPTDLASRFVVSIGTPPGQSSQRRIVFSPLVAGRTYTVTASTNLADWGALGSYTISDDGPDRIVTDLDAGAPAKFYRVEITRP